MSAPEIRERTARPDSRERSRPVAGDSRAAWAPPAVPTPPATRRLGLTVFVATLVIADLAALTAGLFATYWLRFESGLFPTPRGVPGLGSYAGALLVVLPLGVAVNRKAGLYSLRRQATAARDALQGSQAVAFTCVLLAAVAFFYRDFSFSRTFLVGYAVVTAVAMVSGRVLVSLGHRALRARGIGIQRVAIVGGGDMGERLERDIRRQPGRGLEIVDVDESSWGDGGDELSERALRPMRIRSLVKAKRIDRLIVTDPGLTHEERLDLVEACHGARCRCDFVPDLFEVMMGRARVEEIDGIPLIGSKLHPLDRVDRFKKRTLDLLVSGLSMIVFSPLIAMIALAVRVDSGSPVLYRQRRLGRDGREFDMLKFRSMPLSAESASGPVYATKGDVRPTAIGRVLRRTSLDELPQLWNVFRGEMSLVGPRPERPFFVDQYQREIPRYLERHGVKSGLTGWAQANGLRGDTSIEERTRYDIWYVENWSVRLDLKILVLTLFRFLFQKEAY